MRVIAQKIRINDQGDFILAFRAEEIPEDLKGAMVSLARRGNGYCMYRLDDLASHDSHSPVWLADGSAPPNSSAPDMTVEKYLDRIWDDIEALAEAKKKPSEGTEG